MGPAKRSRSLVSVTGSNVGDTAVENTFTSSKYRMFAKTRPLVAIVVQAGAPIAEDIPVGAEKVGFAFQV